MTYQLTLEPLGATIDVEEGQTVLDAALRQGIYIPHACGHGLCGTCKVQVLEGEVDNGQANTFALMDMEREDGMTLACCATLMSDVSIEADIDDEPDAEVIPVRDFKGICTRIEQLTPTIKALHFKLDAPIHYQAGQYVQVHIPGLGESRAFSIANPPGLQGDASEIELNVRLVPGGAATTWLHEQLSVGVEITIAGPYGRFFVRRSAAKPMVFIAGGSGLSSPRSMILELLASECRDPITLIYGQRSKAELYYDQEFRELAEKHPHFTYIPVISDSEAEDGWAGARGYAHEAAKAHFDGCFAGNKAYLCGPPAMIEACISTLMQGRLFENDIYTEKFLSAADASQTRSPLFKRV
ncbi:MULTISPECIES: NADH:ubiquinone reductase (Na(+)-transporting) subunit F [Alcaligenaceae]|uniref:Phenol 2-monooxygenase P5 subunit n=2 Tax=Alcaligenaceae TaxID=506 RepID=A0A366H2X4_9BURK|nr:MULTISPECIES: 2Fe-2S iron-sulfur cluster binding domain-containing protein [Alcaligenaceae]MCI2810651.1 2Fe-2S iron-sulfur cluster binding domain-containing protein [Eoetvoesiella caeni]NYT56565.1 2Fe-2S iron-sulfur cluster binding domain-containing protein [Eoetvoesiella caeni]RBP36274.1 phenol 2-monooxygenase P5 subunit [Eoetvoesiella caeni]RIY38873.1 phenol hydroxylase [Neopusillimonas maritima]